MPAWTGPLDVSDIVDRPIVGRDDVTRLLVRAVALEASEVIFQTGRPVLAQIHGRLLALTRQWLQPATISRISVDLTGTDSMMSKLYSGRDADRAVPIEDRSAVDATGEPLRHRFRVNLTPNHYEGDIGVQLVCRHIPFMPPTVTEIGIEAGIVAESTPAQGAVVIAGETGSGKTTTFAALIRRVLEETTPIVGNVLTFEAPIEFVFEGISSATCTISQHEIGVHLGSFADGVRGAMRRKPALIVVGEVRDRETIAAMVEASNTGHPIYTTTHANDVASIIRRLTLKFPAEMQFQAFHDVLSTVRLLISQVLVPRVGGGRTCLREWQVVTDPVRREISEAGPEHATVVTRDIVDRDVDGRSMRSTVHLAHAAGTIDAETARRVLYRYGYRNDPLAA